MLALKFQVTLSLFYFYFFQKENSEPFKKVAKK